MKKNSHNSAQTFTHSSRRIKINTLVAALIAAGCATPTLAVDRTWFGGTGDWSTSANWAAVGAPVVGDMVIIGTGTSTLSFAQVVAGLTLNGGTLAGIGNLTLSGGSLWNSGTQSGAGITQFNGGLAITGDGSKALAGGRVINTAGTTVWGGNTFANGNAISNGGGTGTINNVGTGVWNDTNAFATYINSGAFNNVGAYNKQGNSMTTIASTFNNTGAVSVQNNGTLSLSGGGASNGSFAIASGATLLFGGGTHNLNSATSSGTGRFKVNNGNVILSGALTHAGELFLDGGTFTANGNVNTARFTQSGGTLAGTGTTTVTGTTTWNSGTQSGAGITQFNGGLAITGNGGKALAGGRVINTAGTTVWGGNTFASDNAINNGSGGGTINNTSTGVWNDTNAFDAYINSGPFNNAGTYNKQGNSLTIVYSTFNNTGAVSVQNNGTLSLSGGGASNGSFAIASGATLLFDGGTHNLNSTTSSGTGRFKVNNGNVILSGALTHAGELFLDGGTFTANGNVNTARLTQSGGTLAGIGTTTVTGAATWNSGEQSGAGITQYNGGLVITGDGGKALASGRVINTAGTTIWGGNTFASDNAINNGSGGGTINNVGTGVWNDTNAFDAYINSGLFNNVGTYNKQGNSLTIVYSAFNNTGTTNVNNGTLNIASNFSSAGVIDVDAGAIFQASGTTFTNAATGVISGNGTVATPTDGLSNSGKINPGNSIGHLTINGDLKQALTGVLNFELTSLTSFDLLTVTDDVILGGKIAVLNLGYMPTLGDSFKVMTFNDRAGTMFDSLSVNGFGSGVTFNVLYNSDNVTLQVAAVPEAETWAMMLAGLGLVGFAVRRRNVLERGTASV